MALGTGALVELAMNPKVHDVAERLIASVYGRIFKARKLQVEALTAHLPPTDRELLERLIASQPTNDEMAMAFASLQAELRRGQQRLWIGIALLGVANLGFLAFATFAQR